MISFLFHLCHVCRTATFSNVVVAEPIGIKYLNTSTFKHEFFNIIYHHIRYMICTDCLNKGTYPGPILDKLRTNVSEGGPDECLNPV